MASDIVLQNYDELGNELQFDIMQILSQKACIRSDLVRLLKRPRTTIYDNLEKLINLGLVESFSKTNHKRGRPFIFFQIKNK